MNKVIVYGGLTQFGGPIIDHFLKNGKEVIAVRSGSNTVEEDIEMFFGRHALFRSVESDWEAIDQDVTAMLCLDSAKFMSNNDSYVQPEVISDRMTKCFEACPQLTDIIIASHIDIYGNQIGSIDEKTPVTPITEMGRHVDRVERGVIQNLLQNKKKARTIRAFICRLPYVYTDELLLMPGEQLHIEDCAEGFYALFNTTFSPCIEVFQFTSGRLFQTVTGTVRYSFKKAKEMIDFTPTHTLEND